VGKRLTRGQRNAAWIEDFCRIPEGRLVGQPVKLTGQQKRWLRRIYDTPTRTFILSMGRGNAKTAFAAFLLLLHLCGPEALPNSQLFSAAQSRDQAAILFGYAAKCVRLSADLEAVVAIRETAKQLACPELGTLYRALSADASTAHGLSPAFVVHDELGQVRGPRSGLYEALETAQSKQPEPLSIIISTQAPGDADLLSVLIDDALRGGENTKKIELYTAKPELEPFGVAAIKAANPHFDEFMNRAEVLRQAAEAKRLPGAEAAYRNLILNQRVALERLWLAPAVWKACAGAPDPAIFRDGRTVAAGLDLSQRNDLTACVLAAQDDAGSVHLMAFVFAPERGLPERELRDRAPYTTWVQHGFLTAVPGATIDYDWLFQWLRIRLDDLGIRVEVCAYDRWRINEARAAAERNGFVVSTWSEVGQGYQSMSPRVEHFETLLLQGRIRHGAHPLLNMAAAAAIVVRDAAGNRKIDKSHTTQRIDPLVAAVMAAGVFVVTAPAFDVASYIA
jgi:phage terminase large subunit-like protein